MKKRPKSKSSRHHSERGELYHYLAFVERVVDGDTIDVTIDLGMFVSTFQRLRLFGINAPEVRGPQREAGIVSKRWLIDRIEGKEVRIETRKDKKGKFGRYLAVVLDDDGDICQEMIAGGLAVEY